MTASEAAAAAPGIEALFGFPAREPEEPVAFAEALVADPVTEPPGGALGEACSTDRRDRALHARGSSYLDTVRAFRGLGAGPRDKVRRVGVEAPEGADGVQVRAAAGVQRPITPVGAAGLPQRAPRGLDHRVGHQRFGEGNRLLRLPGGTAEKRLDPRRGGGGGPGAA
ncbi:MAG: hypothetical protein ACKOTA_09235, partial [Solirubrobacterales bacterium]